MRFFRFFASSAFLATPVCCGILLLASFAWSPAAETARSAGGNQTSSPSDVRVQRPTFQVADPSKSRLQADRGETPPDETVEKEEKVSSTAIVTSLTVFVLAIFVGFEVITKVPATLHTPLMSGANAISGITLVGAVIVAGKGLNFAGFIGMAAVALATVNVIGGFLVTHRMLSMFKKR